MRALRGVKGRVKRTGRRDEDCNHELKELDAGGLPLLVGEREHLERDEVASARLSGQGLGWQAEGMAEDGVAE